MIITNINYGIKLWHFIPDFIAENKTKQIENIVTIFIYI